MHVVGHQLVAQGKPFHFAGWNTYYLMVYAADAGLVPLVDEVFNDADALGLSVLRTWAFNDGAGQWNALQTAPGTYDEQVFRGLDYVVWQAGLRGVRLILPLVNNWDDYGGMNQYVAWSPTATGHDDFYSDPSCQQWFKNHVTAVLKRVNTYTNIAYRDDPTILAWELANEARCVSDSSGATLQSWLDTMAAHVKAVDPNHLLTTGIEGFYAGDQAAKNPASWMSTQGVDFIANHSGPDIDFASVHLWPDSWGFNLSDTVQWVSDHGEDGLELLNKPVVVEEFGKQGSLSTRDLYYQAIYQAAYDLATSGGALAGTNFWSLYHDAYAPFDDGYGVFAPADVSTTAIIMNEAALIHALP